MTTQHASWNTEHAASTAAAISGVYEETRRTIPPSAIASHLFANAKDPAQLFALAAWLKVLAAAIDRELTEHAWPSA